MIMAPRQAYRQPQAGSQGFARTKKVYGNSPVTFVAADIALNAQCAVMRVPKGFVLQAMSGTWGDLDSGATLSMSIGDAGNAARFAATATTMQAGGAVGALAAGGLLYEFTDDTDILVTSTVAGAGLGPTPTLSLIMEGYIK
jgi:hypothetical protein